MEGLDGVPMGASVEGGRRDSLTRNKAPLRNAAGILLSTLVLESPESLKAFESKVGQKWAKEIIIDYYSRTEEGWLLGPMVKILTIMAKQNPTPGGLSRSYCLEVFYKVGVDGAMVQEHWFVKIPLSLQTIAMDERELVMYNNIFPKLQVFLSEKLYEDEDVDLPIPIIYYSSFLGDGVHDCLVTENLCMNRYFQVDKDTTKLAYMRAAMTSLAYVHGITFSFMKSLGGKEQLLAEFPTIKEQVLPQSRSISKLVNKLALPYLMYLARTQPDISTQAMVLAKFHKFLFRVYNDLQCKTSLKKLMTLVHGDAKIDNFLFKKVGQSAEDKYTAMIIDWQGCGFDLVSNDLMWCLYGFIKNLPETGEMIHGFVEYSLVSYWDELKKVLRAFGDSCKDFDIPEDSEWASELIKEGFTLEFMKNALIRPILSLKNPQLLLDWWRKVEGGDGQAEPPAEAEIFKSDHYSSFIFLFFKIGTEVNVFSHLGKVLFSHMKEAMFADDPLVEEDEEGEDGSDDEEVKEEAVNGSKNGESQERVSDSEVNLGADKNGSDANNHERDPVTPTEGGEKPTDEIVPIPMYKLEVDEEGKVKGEKEKVEEEKVEEKVVTSMYGKVYKLKSGAAT